MDFEHHFADVNEVNLHYVTAGRGRPMVLLHGWPQTWYEWRRVMALLANSYAMIAPDLRGLGDSSRPPSGYDKKTIASDIWSLMHQVLGYERFIAVGHDWGAPTAFRLAADHPDAITHLVMLDVPVPGDLPQGPPSIGGNVRWHHLFHQVPGLPEALTNGRERIYLEWFFANFAEQPGTFGDGDIAEYVRAYAQPGAMHAGFNLYRSIEQDVADNRATLATGFRLPMPTLGLGGGGARGRGSLILESLLRVALHAEGGSIPNCGHFIPEEKPQELATRLLAFLEK
jgi:pimeloyl-ACP methyl ester carboxylesterase